MGIVHNVGMGVVRVSYVLSAAEYKDQQTDGERDAVMEEQKRNGRRTHTTRTGPASSADSDDAVQPSIPHQTVNDDQLLLDAGIDVEDMGEEEKRQILEALRQSLPAPKEPSAHASDQAPMSDKEQDNEEEVSELPEEPPPPAQPLEDKDTTEEVVADSPEAPTLPPQSQEMMSMQYDSEGEDGEQECDSTTTSLTTPLVEDSAAAGLEPGRRQKETGSPQQVESCDQTSGGGDQSDSDSTSDVDMDLMSRSLRKLQDCQRQDMRLSLQQKEQGQNRFKELFNRTRLSQGHSESSQSSVKDGRSGNASVHSSQDLFMECSSNNGHEDSTQPHPSSADTVTKTGVSHAPASKARRSPSPSPSSPIIGDQSSPYDRGDEEKSSEEKEGVGMEDAETQPPEDYEERGGEKQGEGDDSEENILSSPVYPMQVTQVSCSSTPPHTQTSTDDRYLTPSKLPVEDKDSRPLLHDNWFSWPSVPPVCCLHRTYRSSSRKETEPVPDLKPYFCPQSESVSAYSEVILCMLDSYLQQFSAAQRCLHSLLPWGKPVRAGMHQPGSLDYKKRGQLDFRPFDLDEDDDDENDFQPAQHPLKRLTTLQRKRRISDDDSPADAEAGIKVKVEAGAGEGEGHTFITLGDRGDTTENMAAYNAETQPMDSDNELPDLHIETVDGGMDSSCGRKGWGSKRGKPVSPVPVSEDSQGSSSLLNEQGDLYSTQLPRRKRVGQIESESMVTQLKRSRRAAPAAEAKEDSPERLRPLGRKRKQAPSSNMDSKVLVVDDDDDEKAEEDVLLRRKVRVQRKRPGYLHISSTEARGEGKAAVVHPTPRSHCTGEEVRQVMPLRQVNDGKQNPQPGPSSNVSSSSDMKRGGGGEEDSNGSVLYLESPSGDDGAPSSGTDSHRVRLIHQRHDDDQEEGDDRAVGTARFQAQDAEEKGDNRSEELVTCPLCSKQFASNVIERHASDCSLEIEAEGPAVPLHSTAPLSLPPTSQLKRRPLRGHLDREDYVCGLCHIRQGGSGALKRHFQQCQLKFQKEEASSSFQQDVKPSHTTTTRSAHNWINAYKIPRKVEDATSSTRVWEETLSIVNKEQNDLIEEEESNDSDKDPPFRPTEDDRAQEKDDQKEDRRSHRPARGRQQD